MQQVREALITTLTRIGRHPKNCAIAAAITSKHRRTCPALFGKYLSGSRHCEAGNLDRLLPDDGQLRTARVDDTRDSHPLLAATEPKGFSDRRFAFENQDRALVHSASPILRGRRSRPEYEQSGQV